MCITFYVVTYHHSFSLWLFNFFLFLGSYKVIFITFYVTSYHYNFLIITFLTFLFLKKKYLPSFLIWKSYKVILAALMHNLSRNNLSPQLFDFPFSKKKYFCIFFWKVTNCTHNFFDSLYIILQTTYHHTIFFMTIRMPFFFNFHLFLPKIKVDTPDGRKSFFWTMRSAP